MMLLAFAGGLVIGGFTGALLMSLLVAGRKQMPSPIHDLTDAAAEDAGLKSSSHASAAESLPSNPIIQAISGIKG